MGGGSESSSNYFQSEIVFFGIDNIHAMRESLAQLRDYLDTHGANSSDGMSSFLRHGGSSWTGGNLSSMSASVSTLGDTGWLSHVQNVLAGSAWIAARIAIEKAFVLVHCSDGCDRTTQLVALASLLLDPYYRTIKGFQALVEKDWLAFGHPFSDRAGLPTIRGTGSMPYDLTRQSSTSSTASFSSSPMRQQSSGSFTSQAPNSSRAQSSNNSSPIFLQWVDCVSQLLRIEMERQQAGISDSCGCVWAYLSDLHAPDGKSHVHYNLFYDPIKHSGALLPPVAALAPTLWPQFHLRYASPTEAQTGEIESRFRDIVKQFSEVLKAKEVAEHKAREATTDMESLATELRNEKQLGISAANLAKKATKESDAIKRAIQSLGCKVHFSSTGDVGIERSLSLSQQSSMYSSSRREMSSISQHGDRSDLSVSITLMGDDPISDNPISRVCDTLCPLRTRDGGCRWPDAGCAQLGSQFVGLRANFDAFDKLFIYDKYFESG